MTRFNITKYGKPLDKSLYTWDEQAKTFSSNEDCLVLDFISYNSCTFNTGSYCTFRTGNVCTFNTGSYCTFKTGSDCIFNTGDNCIFDTSSGCTFKTGDECTFDTGYNCTFNTGSNCTFDTVNNCTFDTGSNCTFDTGYNCTFKTCFGCIFNTYSNCAFNTSYDCTFDTGSNCTFKTGSDCIFNTDSDCTFNTSYSCTFNTDSDCILNTGDDCIFKISSNCTFNTKNECVATRRDIFEFYDVSNVKNLTTAPYKVKGYVKDGYYYKDGKKQYKAIIADSILSEIIEHKKNVYRVKNHGKTEITYIMQDGNVYSHGQTLKEAKESLLYKLSGRDTSQYKDYTFDTKVTKKEAIQMYRCITGACEQGTRMFVESLDKVPKILTVKKIIELTEGRYGNDTFRKFFEEVSK